MGTLFKSFYTEPSRVLSFHVVSNNARRMISIDTITLVPAVAPAVLQLSVLSEVALPCTVYSAKEITVSGKSDGQIAEMRMAWIHVFDPHTPVQMAREVDEARANAR